MKPTANRTEYLVNGEQQSQSAMWCLNCGKPAMPKCNQLHDTSISGVVTTYEQKRDTTTQPEPEPEAGEPRTSELPWTLGQNADKCAKNHAICSGPIVIAKVYGGGYPIGQGWSPRSEADAQLIVTAVNHHAQLVAALADELEALRVWLLNQNNAKPEVIEGMLISRQKIADVLRSVRQS